MDVYKMSLSSTVGIFRDQAISVTLIVGTIEYCYRNDHEQKNFF